MRVRGISRRVVNYGLAIAAAVLAAWLRHFIEPLIGPQVAYITVFPVIMVIAVTLGAGPGVASAATGIALVELYFFNGAEKGVDHTTVGRALIVLSTSAYVGWVSARLRAARAQADAQAAQLTQLNTLMDHAQEALIVRELDGSIRFWNQGAAAMYGWRADEALGKTSFSLLQTHGASLASKNEELIRSGHWEGELCHTTRDGQRVTVESRQTATRAPDGHLLILEADRDITARKQAEAERQKFISLADQSGEFIGICDLQYRPVYVNEAGLRMVGLDTLEQALQTPVPEFFFPEDQRFITETFFPRVLREGHAEIEISFRHFKTGEALWMIYNVFFLRDEHGEPVALATVSRNITERKAAEAALRANNEELSRFNEAAVGRELRIIELKREADALRAAAGQPPKYDLSFTEDTR